VSANATRCSVDDVEEDLQRLCSWTSCSMRCSRSLTSSHSLAPLKIINVTVHSRTVKARLRLYSACKCSLVIQPSSTTRRPSTRRLHRRSKDWLCSWPHRRVARQASRSWQAVQLAMHCPLLDWHQAVRWPCRIMISLQRTRYTLRRHWRQDHSILIRKSSS